MSIIGGGLESALAQLAQAQQSVAKDKDRERAASESSRRISDSVRLRVAGVEEADAVRGSGREGRQSEGHDQRARTRPAAGAEFLPAGFRRRGCSRVGGKRPQIASTLDGWRVGASKLPSSLCSWTSR